MSILMGLIQGVAEFLPISSSGHLALFQAFFGMEDVEANHMFFTVLLHFGTLISVCVVYWRDILDMIREFFLGIAALCGRRDTGVTPPPARRLVLLIIVATLPLFVMVFLNDAISTLFANPILVSCALLATGFVLYFSDRMAKGHKTAKNATVADALIVGCGQALAVIPGLSRSGTTITAGIATGLDRTFAMKYSFLLSLPAVLGANLLSFIKAIGEESIEASLIPAYLLGMLAAMLSGIAAISLMKLIAKKSKFGWFAYYCWGAGVLTIILSLIF